MLQSCQNFSFTIYEFIVKRKFFNYSIYHAVHIELRYRWPFSLNKLETYVLSNSSNSPLPCPIHPLNLGLKDVWDIFIFLAESFLTIVHTCMLFQSGFSHVFDVYSEPIEIVWQYHLSHYPIRDMNPYIGAVTVNGNIYFYWNYSEWFLCNSDLRINAPAAMKKIMRIEHF